MHLQYATKILFMTMWMRKLTNAVSRFFDSVKENEDSCQVEHIGYESEYIHLCFLLTRIIIINN